MFARNLLLQSLCYAMLSYDTVTKMFGNPQLGPLISCDMSIRYYCYYRCYCINKILQYKCWYHSTQITEPGLGPLIILSIRLEAVEARVFVCLASKENQTLIRNSCTVTKGFCRRCRWRTAGWIGKTWSHCYEHSSQVRKISKICSKTSRNRDSSWTSPPELILSSFTFTVLDMNMSDIMPAVHGELQNEIWEVRPCN